MEQKQTQEKLWVDQERQAHCKISSWGGEGWGEFSTLYIPGREQEAAVLLLLFCSCQRALTPVWVTGFIFLRKIELICFLNFNLLLFFGFVQFLGVLLQRAHHYF